MRIVALSDTHGYHKKLSVPDGDVFIHAGDFSMRAKKKHVVEFASWVKSLPHKYKIIVPGNHDMACEGQESWAKEEFSPAMFLVHDFVEIEGLVFFGSPYTSSIQEPSDWCYDYPRYGERGKRYWNSINGHYNIIDVMITHGPPKFIGDLLCEPHVGEDPNVGDETLRTVVDRIDPRIHIFGHIHEGYGVYQVDTCQTKFYNVSTCTLDYKPTNPIVTIDIV